MALDNSNSNSSSSNNMNNTYHDVTDVKGFNNSSLITKNNEYENKTDDAKTGTISDEVDELKKMDTFNEQFLTFRSILYSRKIEKLQKDHANEAAIQRVIDEKNQMYKDIPVSMFEKMSTFLDDYMKDKEMEKDPFIQSLLDIKNQHNIQMKQLEAKNKSSPVKNMIEKIEKKVKGKSKYKPSSKKNYKIEGFNGKTPKPKITTSTRAPYIKSPLGNKEHEEEEEEDEEEEEEGEDAYTDFIVDSSKQIPNEIDDEKEKEEEEEINNKNKDNEIEDNKKNDNENESNPYNQYQVIKTLDNNVKTLKRKNLVEVNGNINERDDNKTDDVLGDEFPVSNPVSNPVGSVGVNLSS